MAVNATGIISSREDAATDCARSAKSLASPARRPAFAFFFLSSTGVASGAVRAGRVDRVRLTPERHVVCWDELYDYWHFFRMFPLRDLVVSKQIMNDGKRAWAGTRIDFSAISEGSVGVILTCSGII